MKSVLGFVGLGQMGGGMASRLLTTGAEIIAYDSSPTSARKASERRLGVAATLQELCDKADIVFLSLPNADVVRSVIFGKDGLLGGARKPSMIIDLSTTGPKASIEISSALRAENVEWVEAPVSGGPKGAENGTLAVMCCCRKQVRDQVVTLLANFGKVFFAGEQPGLAQTAKLANNMLSTTALVATAEVMTMCAKAGLDPNVLLEIINSGSGRNSATVDKFPRSVLTRSFDYGFATALAYKDVRLCVDEAENLGVPMIVGAQVRQMMAATNARYGIQSDFTEVVRIYEEWAGVEVTSRGLKP